MPSNHSASSPPLEAQHWLWLSHIMKGHVLVLTQSHMITSALPNRAFAAWYQVCAAELCHSGVLATTWCNLTYGTYRELEALERRLMSLNCTFLCLFSSNYTGRLTVCPTSPCPMVTGLGRAGRYMIGKQNLCLTTY